MNNYDEIESRLFPTTIKIILLFIFEVSCLIKDASLENSWWCDGHDWVF